jgi:hypothetical protein
MRAPFVTVTAVLLVVVFSGVGVGAAEPSQTEVAWASIRDGVFVDQARWEARFAALDPDDKEQVRKLRRLVEDQLAVIEGVAIERRQFWPRFFCLYEAARAARDGAMEIGDALTVALQGHPKGFRQPFRHGREMVREYWALRDGVDCSTAGEVAAFKAGFDDDGPLLAARLVTGHRDSEWGPVVPEREFETHERFKWSDPLLPPEVTTRRTTGALTPTMGLTTGSLLLEGPEGYWSGTLTARTLLGVEVGTWVLTGHGVYEGLSALLTTTEDTSEVSVEGFIFPGLFPPVPEPLEPPTE